MPPDPQEWALAQSRQPGLPALRGPDGDRGLIPLGDTTPAVGGERQGFFARLTALGSASGEYAFKEVQRSPSGSGDWLDVSGGVTGPATGAGTAREPGGNAGLAVGTTSGAVVYLQPSSGHYAQDYEIVPGPPSSIAVFHASGASHSTGIVPDPGSVAGTTKFLREDATWAVPAGGGSSVFAGIMVYNTGAQVFATGTFTLVTSWDITNGFNSGGGLTLSAGTTISGLSSTAYYLVGCTADFGTAQTGIVITDGNGSTITGVEGRDTTSTVVTGVHTSIAIRGPTVGTIKVFVIQTSGANKNLGVNSNFWCMRVG